jgi:hypothetical protein
LKFKFSTFKIFAKEVKSIKWLNLITIMTLLFVGQAFAQISNYNPQIMKEWITATEKLYYGFALNKGQINKEALLILQRTWI